MQTDWDYVFRIINTHSAALDKILEMEAKNEKEKVERNQQIVRALEAIQQCLLTLTGSSEIDELLNDILKKDE